MLLDIYWNTLMMHGPINVKSLNNTSKWQMEFNSAFKGLTELECRHRIATGVFYHQIEFSKSALNIFTRDMPL
jgi:hypothetical protein